MKNTDTQIIDITSLSGYTFDVTGDFWIAKLKGTKTLGADFAITGSGTPSGDKNIIILSQAVITASTYTFSVFGLNIPNKLILGNWGAFCQYVDGAWVVVPFGLPAKPDGVLIEVNADGDLTIKDASIEAVKIGSTLTATIAAKATKTYVDAADVVLQNAINALPASVYTTVSGDITITSGGAASIGANKITLTMIPNGLITNDKINATAAIALSKLAATTASKVLVSDASGFVSASATTPTELAYLAGVTAGTAAASKAVVLDASGKISTIDVTTLKINGTTFLPSSTFSSGSLTTTTVLTAATLKTDYRANGSGGGYDITLPAANTVTADTPVRFYQVGGANTINIKRAGSDDIVNTAGVDVALLAMTVVGDYAEMYCDGSSKWYVLRSQLT
jgi:hypothetical protein